MSIAALIRGMAAAGAPSEAIAIAVEAIEAAQGVVSARRAGDAERKRRQREKSRDSRVTVTGQSADPSPNEYISNPHPTPLVISDEITVPADQVEPEGESDPPLSPEEVLEAWNDMAGRHGLPKAKLTPKRRKALGTRIREHSLNDFTEAIRAVPRSPFLLGENQRGWRADFDFFLQPTSFTRLIEGSYDRATH